MIPNKIYYNMDNMKDEHFSYDFSFWVHLQSKKLWPW
jgi:hypothetical protein